jgi:uroporphyrinogen decarboxylase
MRLDDMRKKYGTSICLKGNVDCKGALCTGTPEDVAAEVKEAMQQSGKTAYICTSSNTIHQGVKPENYRAMIEAIRLYGKA